MQNVTAVNQTSTHIWRYAVKNWAPRVRYYRVAEGHRKWHNLELMT